MLSVEGHNLHQMLLERLPGKVYVDLFNYQEIGDFMIGMVYVI